MLLSVVTAITSMAITTLTHDSNGEWNDEKQLELVMSFDLCLEQENWADLEALVVCSRQGDLKATTYKVSISNLQAQKYGENGWQMTRS